MIGISAVQLRANTRSHRPRL